MNKRRFATSTTKPVAGETAFDDLELRLEFDVVCCLNGQALTEDESPPATLAAPSTVAGGNSNSLGSLQWCVCGKESRVYPLLQMCWVRLVWLGVIHLQSMPDRSDSTPHGPLGALQDHQSCFSRNRLCC